MIDLKAQLIEEIHYVLETCFLESDMAFVYDDKLNGFTLVWKDLYGKRSLIVQSRQDSGELII